MPRLSGRGMLFTAEIWSGLGLVADCCRPLTCTGMAPAGSVFPAKMMFRVPFFPPGSVMAPGGSAAPGGNLLTVGIIR